MRRAVWIFPVLGVAALAASCHGSSSTASSSNDAVVPKFTIEQLQNPNNCQGCHPDHFTEWSGSMHAYASDDPVFLAMNARAQRETGGQLGDFCVKCHAPLALALGETKDGTNLQEVPQEHKGVTCYFCHSIQEVDDTHNNPLVLADDKVLRGGFQDPVPNKAHAAEYSELMDETVPDSSAKTCGACHDIVTPSGGAVERTFAEWQGTVFAHPPISLACSECHMDGRDAVAANYQGVGIRRVHSHMWPAVDLALTTNFPQKAEQKQAVQSFLDTTLQAALCVKGAEAPGLTQIEAVLDNVAAGHRWPSGAVQDRRAWVEVIATKGGQQIYSSGVVADGEDVLSLNDPDLWLIRDCIFDKQDKELTMFWNTASYESNSLPGPVTIDQTSPDYYKTHVYRKFPRDPGLQEAPDKVTMRVRLLPIGLDVLDDLIATRDLDPKVRDEMKALTLNGTTVTWTPDSATIQYPEDGLLVSCATIGLTTGANTANPAAEHEKCSP